VSFLDTLMIVILILIIILKTHDEAKNDNDVPPGSVVVQVEWPPGIEADVDLWVQAPGDVPVGYSNKGARIFNLLRDDLGSVADTTPLNIEYAYSRGQPAGEYTVNLHLYRNWGADGPIVCKVRIMARGENGVALQIFSREVVLTHQGQEITVQRFTLDDKGRVVGESQIPRFIRSGAGSGGP